MKKDMKDINLQLDEKEIKLMTKERYKSIVKQKIEKLGIEYLENVKKSHSETNHLDLRKFSPQQYLFSKCL